MILWTSLMAWGQDLLVDGTTVELSGSHTYDSVRIINSGVLAVAPYDGTAGSGALTLVADLVFVDINSRIDGNGAGFRGVINAVGEGTGGGASSTAAGGGGGHGGAGSYGALSSCIATSGAGGIAYGSLDGLSEAGSAGGAPAGSSVAGGAGGGSVTIDARIIDIRGRIEVDGRDGPVSVGEEGAGGGAGGGITLVADALYCEGVLSARGGDGGNGDNGRGGGGGGGRIEQWSDAEHEPCAALVDPGQDGCGPVASPGADDAMADTDYDGDGFTAQENDCRPGDPDSFPGAVELCDGRDNNCDGEVDEGTDICGTDCERRAPVTTVYQFCTGPLAWDLARLDCRAMGYTMLDISDSSNNNDVNANADAALVPEFWMGYTDIKDEGFYTWESGAAYTYTNWQTAPAATPDCAYFTANKKWEARTCSTPQPYACESCDVSLHYLDADGDGYGDRSTEVYTCHPEADKLLTGTDCDDTSATRTPGGTTDACNGFDDDCDSIVDEGCTCTPQSYNGHDYLLCTSTASAATAQSYCEREGMTLATIDDADENLWLDGQIDALSTQPWYIGLVDPDLDGSYEWLFGGSSYTAYESGEPDGLPNSAACTILNGAAAGQWQDEPCNINRRWVCEEMEGCELSSWYRDRDGDGFGESTEEIAACRAPASYAAAAGDCNDDDDTIFPGATEAVADGTDSDCNGGERCYRDQDLDSYGTLVTIDTSTDLDCIDPGESSRSDDCNDAGPAINPGGNETCGDGIDSNCDGDGEPGDDEDSDGLTWNQEGVLGGSDCSNDLDGDGVPDLVEYQADPTNRDSDIDGIYDIIDDDDDNDFIPTIIEGTGAGETSPECGNPDDGIPNYLDFNSDGDDYDDYDEGYGDADADLLPDFLDCFDDCTTDVDGDGIDVCQEVGLGTDPFSADSDGDGASDTFEVGLIGAPTDTDGDNIIDALDPDDDNDLVLSLLEDLDNNGDPTDDDTDNDSIPNLIDDDDDGDGVQTVLEDRDGDGDPTNDDMDGDGLADWLDEKDYDGPLSDSDGDGLLTGLEEALGADPYSFDSDGDSIEDNLEIGDPDAPTDTDEDGIYDIIDPDDDNDTLLTLDEGVADIDGDGLINAHDLDSDQDGIPDETEGFADSDCDGLVDVWDATSDALCDGIPEKSGDTYEGRATCGCSSSLSPRFSLVWLIAALLAMSRRTMNRAGH